MREILFRAKKKSNNEWIYGFPEVVAKDTAGIKEVDSSGIVTITQNHFTPFVDIDTMGQFTGVYDKTETSIFEGDIVETTSKYDKRHSNKFIVKFGECSNSDYPEFGYIGFYFDEIANERKLRTDILYWVNNYDCKVIGNIYDNPELLNI